MTLNKCLSRLDTIIFLTYEDKNNNIRLVLNDARN